MGKIQVVTCEKGADKVMKHVMLGDCVVGLACVGVNIGPLGQLSLVVLSTTQGNVFVFDVKKFPDIIYKGLGRLLQSVHVLKVVHGSGPIAANLFNQFGIVLRHTFDTQVAFSLLLEQEGLCARCVPLHAVCEKWSVPQYSISAAFQQLLNEDVHAWVRRPLNSDMVNTAAAQALPLVPTLYTKLSSVVKGCRDWFDVLNERALHGQTDPRRPSCLPGFQRHKQVRQRQDRHSSQLQVFQLSTYQKRLLRDTVPPAR